MAAGDASKKAGSSAEIEALATKLAGLFGGTPAASEMPSPSEPASDLSQTELEKEFFFALVDLYRRSATEAGYNATRFAQMLANRGGVETARLLVRSEHASEGYMALWEKGRLDLSVEFVVCSPRYSVLFSDAEIRMATRRLQDWGLDPEDYY